MPQGRLVRARLAPQRLQPGAAHLPACGRPGCVGVSPQAPSARVHVQRGLRTPPVVPEQNLSASCSGTQVVQRPLTEPTDGQVDRPGPQADCHERRPEQVELRRLVPR